MLYYTALDAAAFDARLLAARLRQIDDNPAMCASCKPHVRLYVSLSTSKHVKLHNYAIVLNQVETEG